MDIAASLSTPKVAASLVQVTAAIVTVYRTRGTQLDTYGYAAFGLSVIPYTLMSIINLVGNLVTPDYEAIFMVRSEAMDEAEARGGKFSGVMGRRGVAGAGESNRSIPRGYPGHDNVTFTGELIFAITCIECCLEDIFVCNPNLPTTRREIQRGTMTRFPQPVDAVLDSW